MKFIILNMKLTEYEIYVPHISNQLTILPQIEKLSFGHINKETKVSYSDGLIVSEFWDIMDFTQSYKALRDRWFESSSSCSDIFEENKHELFKSENKISELQYEELIKHYTGLEAKELDYGIAHDVIINKTSISSVAFLHKVKASYVRKVVARFKSNIKKKNQWNWRFLNKRKKITDELIEYICDYWNSKEGKIYTLNDIKLFIDTKYSKEEQVSTSTISKILKLKLGMSYKRMNVLNSSINMKENLNKIIEILSIQTKLLKDNRNVIFLDEFKYCSESTKFFWWSVKNKNAYFQKPIDKFDMGFMIAFSKDEIKAVTAT